MTKGELMKKIYTDDELKNIDPSLPLKFYNDNSDNGKFFWFVMDYNINSFGQIEDMRIIAKNRNINIEGV
tara:strand:+ start:22 stop:231 length:210 start_codon:yes stop_codon:yes gene_type:complete